MRMRALRVDTTLAGFDGLRIRRANHLFLFFGEEVDASGRHLPPGSLLIRDDDEDDDFMVADISPPPSRHSCYMPGRRSVAPPPSHMATPPCSTMRRASSVSGAAAAAVVLHAVRGGSARELPLASPPLSFCSWREREREIETIKRGKETA
uniref:Ankyrin repeat domain-containing protein n=1 Tax=Oryza sativa subsp. japonica TaxID=39947 RepID=Q6Z0S9_ORYSJ|nr:hypothetical protein [Oryza sativa Japonica Group]BAD33018.1 hypothetical protein [Oryza sativa Japonica Group]